MKIVVITSRVPYPLEKGDKLRIFHQLKELSLQHEVVLIAIDTEGTAQKHIDYLKTICAEVHVFRIPFWKVLFQLALGIFTKLPFQVHYYFNKSIASKVNTLINQFNPDIIHCHLIRVAEYVRKMPYKKGIDYMDAFSLGLSRRTHKQAFYLRWIFRMESNRVQKYESSVFDDFNLQIIISEQDRMHIDHPHKSQIKIINNGISSDFLDYPLDDEKEFDLLFTGNMAYQPNIEAASYIARLLPRIKVQYPDIRIGICGVNPTGQVLSLRNQNIKVTGWLPDLRSVYARAKVFIAPMQIGTGIQNKLLEAMAMQIPCITSKLANNALKAVNGRDILECETEQEYLDAIFRLMQDDVFSKKLANNARLFVLNNYDWKSSVAELIKAYQNIKL